MRHLRPLGLSLLAATMCSCGILYTNIKVPRGYRTATPAEVKSAPDDPTVTGQACNRSAIFLFAWGDGSYAAAVRSALGERDGILYDVRADIKVNAYVLGLYTKVCTVLSGKVAKP
ncbi:MAG: hypothetical protein HY403_04965 [Elusimicrobia bacterium]|nr:hypothetical protein [Elusimicrobiota bacterium]